MTLGLASKDLISSFIGGGVGGGSGVGDGGRGAGKGYRCPSAPVHAVEARVGGVSIFVAIEPVDPGGLHCDCHSLGLPRGVRGGRRPRCRIRMLAVVLGDPHLGGPRELGARERVGPFGCHFGTLESYEYFYEQGQRSEGIQPL